MKKYFNIPQFNKSVVEFESKKMGFGFVWRKNNDKPHRLGWFKIVWNEQHECYSWKVVYCGWNIIEAIKELRKPWIPSSI